MNCIDLITIAQLPAYRGDLITVWRYNTNAIVIFLPKVRDHLLLDHVDLTLICASPRMVSRNCTVHCQRIRFVIILCHNNQLPVIELLIAKVDDLRMAAVVLSQQCGRCIRPCFQSGKKHAVCREMVSLLKRIFLPNCIAYFDISLRHYIWKLLQVSDYHDIFRA